MAILRILGVMILLSGMLLVSACATNTTATVIPQANNTYTVTATAAQEADATQAAIKKAKETCEQTKQQLIVMHTKSHYQGSIDRETRDIADNAANILGSVNNAYIPGVSSKYDYKVDMNFRCK